MKIIFKEVRDFDVYFDVVSDNGIVQNSCHLSCCGDVRGQDLDFNELEKIILNLFSFGVDGISILY